MNSAAGDHLRTWIDRPDVRAHDPARIGAFRAALEGPDPPLWTGRHGARVCYAPGSPRRRLLTFDRRGTLVEALRWEERGALRWAKCRMADGRWIGIEPGGDAHPAWGRSDVVWLLDDAMPWQPRERVTVFQSIDYAHADLIPPLAEPARLPAGAGTAILNLLAGLMKDHGAARVRYRGPYPTEALFVTLLESFRYDAEVASPLDRFVSGEALDWLPAPHERHHVAGEIFVQLRQEVDKVVIAGAPYYRREWQGVIRREHRVVRSDDERVVCSLWALGRPLEDRLVLDASGEVLSTPAPAADQRPPAPLPAVWRSALADIIARQSAPALASAIRLTLDGLALEWGPVPGDLLRPFEHALRVSRTLRDAACEWITSATGSERLERAVAFVLDMAHLLGDEVRRRAQRRLEALPEAEQRRILEDTAGPARPPTDSVGRLVTLLIAGQA